MLADLFAKFGGSMVNGRPDPKDRAFTRWPGGWHWDDDPMIAHELDALGIRSGEDLRRLFEDSFYYGCEADDPLVSLGFDRRLNPFGAKLKAFFSSDIGHWDVTDMEGVLEEAFELVEHEEEDADRGSQLRGYRQRDDHCGDAADDRPDNRNRLADRGDERDDIEVRHAHESEADRREGAHHAGEDELDDRHDQASLPASET